MKQLIVWDIDGTLMDCQGVGRLSLNLTLESLYGITDGFKNINFSGTIDRQIIDEAKRLHDLIAFDEASFLTYYQHFLDREIKKNPQIKMLEGIQDLLDGLSHEQNLFHMLCTGNAKVGAWVKLEWTRLAPYFSHGAYGDEAQDRTALVGLAVQRAKEAYGVAFELNQIYVVGDTPLDIEAAKSNGAISVAVATGRYSVEQLKACDPDYVFKNFENIRDFLEVLGR